MGEVVRYFAKTLTNSVNKWFQNILHLYKLRASGCLVYPTKQSGCADFVYVYVLVLFCCIFVVVMCGHCPLYYCLLEK